MLLGAPAYSPFRLDAMKDAMRALVPGLRVPELDARFVYALQTAEAPDEATLKNAADLLGATGPFDGADFFITPRKGTISPWSSKATDIFRNCSVKAVLRVERGVRFKTSGELPAAALGALYDRMTEGVYKDISDIFEAGEPARGRTFDVLARGIEAIREANVSLGLAISEEEMEYLARSFQAAGRNSS